VENWSALELARLWVEEAARECPLERASAPEYPQVRASAAACGLLALA